MKRRTTERRILLATSAAFAAGGLASCSANEFTGTESPFAGNTSLSTTDQGGALFGSGGSTASGGFTSSTTGGTAPAVTGGSAPMITGGAPATSGGAAPFTGGVPATSGGKAPTSGGQPPGAGSVSGDGGATPSTGGSAASGAANGGESSAGSGSGSEVCARWSADRADMSEGEWNGNVDSCDPGDMTPQARANALRIINLYRWLADLSPLETDPERDRKAQACALLQEANGTLSHEPPDDWDCFTDDGADGAGSSNISTGPAVSSVDRYMIDSGNATTIGHRRWILSNSIGPTGIGSTGDGSSCMWTLGGQNDENKPWMAWPPPGELPFEAIQPATSFSNSLDDTGWSIQSDEIDLEGAVVSVTSNGETLPVTTTELLPNYGSRFALRFNPDGWETEAGRTYSISVSGIDEPIEYDVEILDCP